MTFVFLCLFFVHIIHIIHIPTIFPNRLYVLFAFQKVHVIMHLR
jgi:hypothetical protein